MVDRGTRDIVLWDGRMEKLYMYRLDEEDARNDAAHFLDRGIDIIYFFAQIDEVTLKEP